MCVCAYESHCHSEAPPLTRIGRLVIRRNHISKGVGPHRDRFSPTPGRGGHGEARAPPPPGWARPEFREIRFEICGRAQRVEISSKIAVQVEICAHVPVFRKAFTHSAGALQRSCHIGTATRNDATTRGVRITVSIESSAVLLDSVPLLAWERPTER